MRVAKPWKCRLGFHDWDDRENRKTHERYEVARRVRIGVAENSGHRARVASHTMAIGRQTGGSLAPDHSAGAKSFLKLGLFSSTTGEEAGMAVAGVAGVLSLRGDNVTDLFWDLAPGLGRITGTGRLAFPAVRQPGEVQIELAWAGPWVGLPLPVISPALAVLAAPPSRIAVANTVAVAVRNRMFPPEDDADGAETVLETGRPSARTAPPGAYFLDLDPHRPAQSATPVWGASQAVPGRSGNWCVIRLKILGTGAQSPSISGGSWAKRQLGDPVGRFRSWRRYFEPSVDHP